MINIQTDSKEQHFVEWEQAPGDTSVLGFSIEPIQGETGHKRPMEGT